MAEEAAEVAAADADDAVAEPKKRSKAKIYIGAGLGLAVCLGAGGYFAVPKALAMFAPASHAAEASAESGEAAARGKLLTYIAPDTAAADYQIVSIFNGEAFLATTSNLVRVKVGSTAPGLGDILSITESEGGGSVVGTLATLKTS